MIVGFHFPHKTASMFAHKIMQTVSAELGLKYFSQNQVPATHTQLCDLSNEQICGEEVFLRGPVRNFTVLQSLDGLDIDAALRFSTPASFLNGNYKAVCQRRDVLDLVVSQYFSHGWIHPPANGFGERRKEIQAGKISVFEYALLEFEGLADFGQDSILDKYNDLSRLVAVNGPGNTLTLDYEEMVEDYGAWCEKLCSFLPQIGCLEEVLERLDPEYSDLPLRPTEYFSDPLEYVRENQNEIRRHTRSPRPGDHKRFLTEDEITQLRARINPSLIRRFYRKLVRKIRKMTTSFRRNP